MGGKALNGKTITNQEAFDLVERIIINNDLGCKVSRIALAGSARRGKATCGDIDIVFIDKDGLTKKWLAETFGLKKNGKPQTTVLIEEVQVEFYEATEECFGSQLLMWTGSAENNIRLRQICKKKGLTMSQYGIKDSSGKNLTAKMSEEEIYHFLGLDYTDPTRR